jgi:hypothetical protein
MSGVYIKNAASIAYIFNRIAETEKNIVGYIISSSQTLKSATINFGEPGSNDKILSLAAFDSGEGLASTIEENIDKLQNNNYNICVTDAQITDRPINKELYEERNIFIDGIYIGSGSKRHEDHMNKFFSRSQILPDLDEAVEYILNVMFRE